MIDLTDRERVILRHVVEGLGNAEIGKLIGWSEDSVRVYLSRIYVKAGVNTRVGVSRRVTLAVKAVREGWV